MLLFWIVFKSAASWSSRESAFSLKNGVLCIWYTAYRVHCMSTDLPVVWRVSRSLGPRYVRTLPQRRALHARSTVHGGPRTIIVHANALCSRPHNNGPRHSMTPGRRLPQVRTHLSPGGGAVGASISGQTRGLLMSAALMSCSRKLLPSTSLTKVRFSSGMTPRLLISILAGVE